MLMLSHNRAQVPTEEGGEAPSCDSELKELIGAGKKLGEALERLKGRVDDLGGSSELSRIWRLVRKQQKLIDSEFGAMNEKFAAVNRELSGIITGPSLPPTAWP